MNSKYPKCVRAAVLLAAALSASLTSFAQTTSLRGQVTDPSGAAIPGAQVTLRKAPSAEQRTITNEQGIYSFAGIQPGEWTLTVTKPGFSPYEIQGFDISGAAVADVRMEVSLETQKVTVSDDTAGVSTDPTQNVGAIVLKGEDLAVLSDDPDQLAQDLQALAGPSAGPNGGQIFIDGFSGGQLPPKSSIREIRVNQNPFSAEYDRLGFGRIEIFTKPGTDRFRGQLMTMFSDNIFNARNPFVQTRPDFQSRMFEGSLGGPLTKKSSFNLNVEHRGIDENAVINATILDANLLPTRFSQAVVTPNSRWQVTPRFDLALNEKNTLVARYSFASSEDLNNGIGNFSLPVRAYDSFGRNHTFQITETAILSPKMINETRVQYMRRSNGDNGDNTTPAINVLDAFTGGGAQVGISRLTGNNWEAQNTTSFNAGQHAWKFGGRVRTSSLSDSSPQNFGGTFTFTGVQQAPLLDENNMPVLDAAGNPVLGRISSIEQYRRTLLFQQQGLSIAQIRPLGGGASQFTISGGNPLAAVRQTDVGVFLLDDWRVKPNLTLSYGVRYEAQTNISDWSNLSPRLSFAWGIDGSGNKAAKTILRGGTGIFYDRVDDNLTLAARRFNGLTQQSYIVPNPSFFGSVPSLETLQANRIPQNVRELPGDIRAPYISQTSIGIDRQLPKNTSVSVSYLFSRGVHMLRTVSQQVTPDPTAPALIGNLYRYESTGNMRQNQIITNFRSAFSRRVSLFGFYMLNWARGDTDGVGTFPAASDYSLEYGSTMFDVRNRLFMGGSISGPRGITLNPFITASTGMPFNITTGLDNNRDTIFNDRPAFATDPAARGVVQTRWGLFNTSPGPNDVLIPRNFGRGPGQFGVNMRASKTWGFGKAREAAAGGDMGGFGGGDGPRGGGPPMMRGGGGGRGPGGGGDRGGMFGGGASGRRFSLTLSVSARNLLNRVNLSPPVGNLSSPLFGQSLSLAGGFGPMGASAASNRRLDFSLRLSF